MPLRENQVYQIGLITAVFLMVVAGAAAYYGLSSASQQENANRKLQDEINKLKVLAESGQYGVSALVQMIGYKEPSELGNTLGRISDEAIKNDVTGAHDLYEKAIKSYGVQDELVGKKTLESVIQNLLLSLNEKSKQALSYDSNSRDSKEELEREKKRFRDVKQKYDADVAKLQREKDQLADSLRKAKADFDQKVSSIEKTHVESLDKVKEEKALVESQKRVLAGDLKKSQTLANALEVRLRKFERVKFLVPDGRIVDVSPATKKAYVNLGFADGLYPRVSFSVFGDGVPLEAGKEKGAIEIIRVLSDHQAEARITNYNPKDPIVRNDRIVTATWDPGQNVKVAIAGIVDFDEDGVSDMTQLKGFIRKNRGKLVGVSSPDGKILGGVDLNTEFLIVGEVPGNEAHRKSFAAMVSAAEKYRVRQISVRDFLHLNGYHPEPRIQSLLEGPKKTADGFKPRKPPEGSSAFDR